MPLGHSSVLLQSALVNALISDARPPASLSGALLLFLVDVYIFILMGSVIVQSEIEGGKTTQHTACTKNGKQISIVKRLVH